MPDIVIRIGLSFIVAGFWISGATLIGERLGVRKAGLITNLPSNILISLLFVSLTRGPGYASALTAGVPMGMLIDTIFLVVYIFVLPRGVWKALALGLIAWAASAALAIGLLPPMGFWLAAAIYLAGAAALFLLVSARLPRRNPQKKPVSFSWRILGLRAFFAGCVVAGSVTIAQVAPPYMTGIFATFPAVLTSTLVILSLSQGADFAQATGRILVISSSNIVVYAAVAGLVLPLVGPWLGTLIAFAAAFLFILALGKLIERLR
ncbi:MAG TPA: hypothetical protein VIO60_06800 [Rectinemataceae bacterium]